MLFTLQYAVLCVVLAVTMAYSDTSSKNEPMCNCDYCDDETENNIEEKNKNTTIPALYKEDKDGDGNLTICARDRDFNDRTFPSVCHMLCYNRCLILRLSTVKENSMEKPVVIAFRNSK